MLMIKLGQGNLRMRYSLALHFLGLASIVYGTDWVLSAFFIDSRGM